MAEPAKKEDVDPQAERDRVLRNVVKEWNTVVTSLLRAAAAWDAYCQLRKENRVNLEEFPLECQRALMLANPNGELDFIVEDMITRGNNWQNYLKDQIIKIK